MTNIILGFIYLSISYEIFNTKSFFPVYGNSIEFDILSIPISIILGLIGLYHIIFFKKIKYIKENDLDSNISEYSICPKCEETFNYYELKDGMCPYCNIPTKDLDGYYDDKSD